MKKIMHFLLAIIVVSLCACSSASPGSADSGSGPLDEPATRADYVLLPIGYNSVDALLKGISSGITGDKFREIEEREYNKGTFRSFIEGLRRDGAIYIPHYEGNVLGLRKEEGYNSISVFPTELYGKPCISYFPEKDKTGIFCIFMMKLDEGIVAEANKNGVSWLMRQMNPHGTKDGVDPYPLYYKITDEEIVLKTGTVKALFGQFDDDQRSYIHVVYDNVFATILVMPGSAGKNWLRGLSFEKVPLDSVIGDAVTDLPSVETPKTVKIP